ncbi:Uncharacterised protein [Mycobacteroides abscessus]|nr:Uncharacterised protein [Mycobacteroides abscessus]CPS17275.1 Uncharacterised protein [Mycobacteroides abscessus]CPS22514.1 Uncharacterised protein [Mycobacteroides abscessus]CPS90408.1 Uncharacterised protein [Mycobacteroides abscessus]CPT45344.1 Uncharacterised protein [Mycobacteroides abscessus]
MLDTVLAADHIKEHLDRRMIEPAGEHLAVIGQNLLRHSISGDCIDQPVTDRASAFPAINRADTHIRE